MKKQTFLSAFMVLTAVCSATLLKAQNNSDVINPIQPGIVTLSVGIGNGTEYSSYYYNPAVALKAVIEAGLWKAGPGTITLGAQVGSSSSNGGYFTNYKTNTFVLAGRTAWHHGWDVSGLDTYAGLSLGFGFNHYEYVNGSKIKQNEIIRVFGGFFGASYFVSPNFGFNAELGQDITRAQIGVIFKLK